MSNPPAVIDFLDQDFSYKLEASQIQHYAGLAPVPKIILKWNSVDRNRKGKRRG